MSVCDVTVSECIATLVHDVRLWMQKRANGHTFADPGTKYAEFGDSLAAGSEKDIAAALAADEAGMQTAAVCADYYLLLQHTRLPDKDGKFYSGVHVQQIAVHPKLRRRGVGTAILCAVKQEAANEGMAFVFVESVLSDEMNALMQKMILAAEFEKHVLPDCYVAWLNSATCDTKKPARLSFEDF